MFNDPYTAHVHAVDTLTAAGIPAPVEWAALRTRFSDAVEAASVDDTVTRAAAALIDGDDPATVQSLWALAAGQAAATSIHRATVANGVRAAVLRRLYALYEPTAGDNWTAAADLFDKAAAAFTKAADTVDPEAPATAVMGEPEKVRKAWTEAEFLVHDIDAAIPVLSAAAALCGIPADGSRESAVALTLDTTGHKRRYVWTAWETTGTRCGRWSALHAAGVTLRAARTAEDAAPYRKPKPVETRQVPVGRGRWEYREIDPEDEFEAPASAPAPTITLDPDAVELTAH
jgi:hypothetical protein